MKKNYSVGVIIGAVIIAGASFWGGMTYAKSSTQSGLRSGNGQFFAGGTSGSGARTLRGGANGGVTAGSVIAKDANSITVQLADGSTKIVLVGTSTEIMKTAAGTLTDVAVGANVMVSGTANADGSITAQTVSLRPAGTPGTRVAAPAGQ